MRRFLKLMSPSCIHLAHDVASSVFDRRQALRERPLARPITLARSCHADRLMRPVMVVEVPPGVEGALALVEIGQTVERDLGLHRAMQPFVLALRLRMIGAAMRHPNSQPQQPHRERGKPPAAAIAPRRAVVHQHGIGQPVAAEHGHQMLARGSILLVTAGLRAQRVARVVIDHGQRMAAPARQRKVALEVHLPELVRLRTFEPLVRARMLAARAAPACRAVAGSR